MFLLAADTFMGQDVGFLLKLVGGLAALYAVFRHVTKAKRDIIADLKRELLGDAAEQEAGAKRIIGPQPFDVRMHSDCVKRGSYENHAKINRDEHARMEKEFKDEVRRIAESHNKLAREVSEINARSETNEQRLIQIDTKIDNLGRDIRNS